MKRIDRISLACAVAVLAAGCSKDTGPTLAPTEPLAYTRFVNVVPDTSAMDYRFVDVIENSPIALALAYRGLTPYQATGVGARHIRVFPTSTDFNTTTKIVLDTTITFEANTYYTIVHVGYARAGSSPKQQFVIIQDNAQTTSTAVAVRAINFGIGLGAVDIFTSPTGGPDPLPSTATFKSVPYGTVTPYTNLSAGTLALRATPSGAATPVLADNTAPPGAPADLTPSVNLQAIGGSTQPGSAIAAILTPRSVAGSAAPQTTAFQAPAFVYLIDKHPR
jgi:hypothetical protein